MGTTVKDAVFDLFRAHGVTTIFGNRLGAGHRGAGGGKPARRARVATAMGALVNAAAGRVPLVLTAGQQARSLLTMGALLASEDPSDPAPAAGQVELRRSGRRCSATTSPSRDRCCRTRPS